MNKVPHSNQPHKNTSAQIVYLWLKSKSQETADARLDSISDEALQGKRDGHNYPETNVELAHQRRCRWTSVATESADATSSICGGEKENSDVIQYEMT
jgi:hypothetical protein